MANKNITSPTAIRIFSAWEREGRSERARTYLGASIIGHECDMYLWLNFRGAVHELFDGRMYRLFDRGKREEAVFCNDLRRIGIEVREFDENGNQWAVSDLGGHFSGHLDGIARGFDEAPKQWFVTEFKTHSDTSFKKLAKEGVKRAKPTHYAQMQVYMGKTGLKKALYMAVNKDNDDLWIEVVDFNKAAFDAIMVRAKHIIDTTQPARCASRRDDFRCKLCPAASICWHDAHEFVDPLLPLNCRTCCHATADTEHDGANWTCGLGHSCSTEQEACADYLILPVFVKGELTEGDENGILYSFEVNGKTDGITIGKRGFSAQEAQKFGPEEYRKILEVRENEGKVTAANTLEMKYADKDKYEVYYTGKADGIAKAMPWSCDLTKPIRTEDFGGKRYFEYAGDTLVVIDGDKATVISEKVPF